MPLFSDNLTVYGDTMVFRGDLKNKPTRGLSLKLCTRAEGGTARPENQWESLALPFARLLDSTLRPFLSDILFMKPCSFFL